MIPHISLSRAYCATLIALIHPIALPMTCFFPMTLFFLSRFSWHIYHPNLSLGFGVAVGTAVGAAVGAAVGLAVGAAVGTAVGFAVGAGVGLAALPEGLLLEVWELLGFAVTAGFGVAVALALPAVLLSVLLSGFGVAVGLTVAAAPAEGVAVGFADALGLALACGRGACVRNRLAAHCTGCRAFNAGIRCTVARTRRHGKHQCCCH